MWQLTWSRQAHACLETARQAPEAFRYITSPADLPVALTSQAAPCGFMHVQHCVLLHQSRASNGFACSAVAKACQVSFDAQADSLTLHSAQCAFNASCIQLDSHVVRSSNWLNVSPTRSALRIWPACNCVTDARMRQAVR